MLYTILVKAILALALTIVGFLWMIVADRLLGRMMKIWNKRGIRIRRNHKAAVYAVK